MICYILHRFCRKISRQERELQHIGDDVLASAIQQYRQKMAEYPGKSVTALPAIGQVSGEICGRVTEADGPR